MAISKLISEIPGKKQTTTKKPLAVLCVCFDPRGVGDEVVKKLKIQS